MSCSFGGMWSDLETKNVSSVPIPGIDKRRPLTAMVEMIRHDTFRVVVLNGGDFAPLGTLGNVWSHF